MIKLGDKDIKDIKLGDKQVQAVYLGDKLVWELSLDKYKVKFGEDKAGDVLFYDSIADDKFIVDIDNAIHFSNNDRFTPIGIVAIPSKHDVYETGECGIISLPDMCPTNPDKGSINYHEYIDNYVTYEGVPLTTFNYIACIGTVSDQLDEITSYEDTATIPFIGSNENYLCKINNDASYSSNSDNPAPCPYLKDGSINPLYIFNGDTIKTRNCLSDIDGKYNTKIILEYATYQTDWKTANVIDVGYKQIGCFPHECCSWRFYTKGTNQGDWYIPAIGECGFYTYYNKNISSSFEKLYNIFEGKYCYYHYLDTYTGFKSSTITGYVNSWTSYSFWKGTSKFATFDMANNTTGTIITKAFTRYKPTPKPIVTTHEDVGKAVLWDNQEEKKIIVSADDLDNYDTNRYTPIGVVVIPSSHDVYGTGEGAMISIVLMSNTNPDNGAILSSDSIVSYIGNLICGSNFEENNYIVIYDDNIKDSNKRSYYGNTQCANQTVGAVVSVLDNNCVYQTSSNITPSPYLTNGSKNEDYSITKIKNILSKFDGKENTSKALDLIENSDWKISSTIENISINFYTPGCCAWRYHTSGTQQGDWYIPSIAELGYAVAREKCIIETANKLKVKFNINNTFNYTFNTTLISSSKTSNNYVKSISHIDSSNYQELNYSFQGLSFAFCRI